MGENQVCKVWNILCQVSWYLQFFFGCFLLYVCCLCSHVSKQTQFERPTRPQFSSLPYHSNSQLSLESRSSGGSHTASHNRHSVYSQNSMSSFTSEQTITAVPAPGQALQTPTIPAPVEIPEWLLVYARTPTNDHRLDVSRLSIRLTINYLLILFNVFKCSGRKCLVLRNWRAGIKC
jgi:hypothetical protein